METQLREIIRSVVRKDFMNEMSKNDIHVKEIMKFYDKGTYSTKKAVSIFVSGKTNANRNQILDDLGDMGYNDIWDVMDHFKLKLESVNEAEMNPVKKVVNAILKKHGVNAMKTTSTSVRGFHNIVNNGYSYDGNNFLRFYKVSPGVVEKVADEIQKAGVRVYSVNKSGTIKGDFSKTGLNEAANENTINEGFGDSIKKIRNLAIKMASTKYDRAKSHLNIDKIASVDDFDGKDTMNKATTALLQQNDLDEDLKTAINKIAVKLGTGATMLGVITALVSMSGWIQYLDSSFTKWYYTEIQHLAEPEVMKVMQDLGRAGQAEGSIYGKFGMYAFFIFFTIAVISLVAARLTKGTKKEYVDKKGVEHVAAALPQTEEEPIKECKTCNSK
jgi:hypothetical protein